MEDPNLDIAINADSSGAIEAFDGLDSSVSGFGQQLTTLGETFNRPLEHVGLQIFAKDLLSTVGLAGEARPIVGLLQAAIGQLGSAFSIAAGPIGLVVAGLTAAGAIIYKVVESQKEHGKSIEDVVASEDKELSATNDLKESLTRYKDLVHTTSPELNELVIATDNYTTAQKKLLVLDLTKQLADLKKQLDAVKESHRGDIEATATTAAMYDHWASSTTGAKDATEKFNTSVLKQDEDTAKLKFRISELNDELTRYAKTGDLLSSKDFYKKQADNAEEAKNKQLAADKETLASFNKNEDYKRRTLQESLAYTKQIIDSKYNIEIAALHGVGAENAVFAKNLEDDWGNAYLSMAKGAGDSFASMLVDSDSFQKDMDQIFKNVLKSFISMLIEMEVRWAAAAFLSYLGIPVVPSTALPSTIPGHATGADFVASRPTLMMVGEGGEDERVQVTPRSQAQVASVGGNSGGGDTYNISVVNQISGGDSDQLAEKVMQKTIYAIRARGQLNFVRGA
jgi:hypothetical protein